MGRVANLEQKLPCLSQTLWFKDVLMGKAVTPKTDEVLDVESEEGKKKAIIDKAFGCTN